MKPCEICGNQAQELGEDWARAGRECPRCGQYGIDTVSDGLRADVQWFTEAEAEKMSVMLEPQYAGSSYSTGSRELEVLLKLLEHEKFITFAPSRQGFAVSVEGLLELEKLASTGGEFTQGFVAMWFDKSLHAAWTHGFDPAPTCRADEIGKLHFDIRHLNTLPWKEPSDLAVNLTKRIVAVVGSGPFVSERQA